MKKIINAIIVVEGKSDVQFLESFIDAEFVITNGSDVPRETINYLKNSSLNKKILVLTDPDSPGKRIRDILNNEIPNLLHAYVDKKECIKKHKVGVAESNKEHILNVLDNVIENTKNEQGNWGMEDLYVRNLCGSANANKLRIKVMQELHLGFGNAKTLLKRLNSLNISKDKVDEVIKKVNL